MASCPDHAEGRKCRCWSWRRRTRDETASGERRAPKHNMNTPWFVCLHRCQRLAQSKSINTKEQREISPESKSVHTTLLFILRMKVNTEYLNATHVNTLWSVCLCRHKRWWHTAKSLKPSTRSLQSKSVQTTLFCSLRMRPQNQGPPCVYACKWITCVHQQYVVHVRDQWIMETLK